MFFKSSIIAFGSIIFLKERPSALLMIGAVIALLGSIMISVLDYSQDKVWEYWSSK